eukprot:sb/3477748/
MSHVCRVCAVVAAVPRCLPFSLSFDDVHLQRIIEIVLWNNSCVAVEVSRWPAVHCWTRDQQAKIHIRTDQNLYSGEYSCCFPRFIWSCLSAHSVLSTTARSYDLMG